MKTISDIIDLVANANPDRKYENLSRRIIKIFEEIGEVSEAFLSSTSDESNRKNKSHADVQEEAVDVLIVAIDIALTKISEI